MEILRMLSKGIVRNPFISLMLLFCASFSYSASVQFYIVTSAALNASEISSKIFFSSLILALEDAIMNTSKNFTKNFTIYLSNTDTYQPASILNKQNVINLHLDNSLDITVIPFPCDTSDAILQPYIAYCAKKRPKILFNSQSSVYVGTLSSITMKEFDMIADFDDNLYVPNCLTVELYCDINDCQEKKFNILFQNMTISSLFIAIEAISKQMDINPNIKMNDIQIIW